MELVIIYLITALNGNTMVGAELVQRDGDSVFAMNDNEVYNATIFQSYVESNLGSCTIYEDFSLSGECAAFALDPDDDVTLNGVSTLTGGTDVY